MSATRTTAVTVRLGKALADQLTAQAQLEGTTSADILRKALDKYVEANEQHAMLDDLRQGLLARLESLERCIVAEIGNLVAIDDGQGGAQ
ncbi:MAG: ribbon-helix-helix protein, CopG family [Candidatus Saccharibacteria bacterium]|nr:ribbon-helix-helix protein, CopG family [Rhodoferax sp.]